MGQKRVLLGLVETVDLVDNRRVLCPRMSRRCAASATASRTSLTRPSPLTWPRNWHCFRSSRRPRWSCRCRRPPQNERGQLLAVERPRNQRRQAGGPGPRTRPAIWDACAQPAVPRRSCLRMCEEVHGTQYTCCVLYDEPAGLDIALVVDVDQRSLSRRPTPRLKASCSSEERANLVGVGAIPSLGAPAV